MMCCTEYRYIVYDCNALTDVICIKQVWNVDHSSGWVGEALCTYIFLAPSTSDESNGGWVNR